MLATLTATANARWLAAAWRHRRHGLVACSYELAAKLGLNECNGLVWVMLNERQVLRDQFVMSAVEIIVSMIASQAA